MRQSAGDSHDALAHCHVLQSQGPSILRMLQHITSFLKDINQRTMSPMCCVLGLLQAAAVSAKSGIESE